MITDEQVKLAVNTYFNAPPWNSPPSKVIKDMRKALETYEQSKWVKFTDGMPNINEEVLFCVCGEIDLSKYGLSTPVYSVDNLVDAGEYVLAVHQDEAIFDKSNSYWQHLPKLRSES